MKIKLYRITPTYADAYKPDYWATHPVAETHPATGLPYDDWTSEGPYEFELPDGVAYDEDMGMLYDEHEGRYLDIHDKHGEPAVWINDDFRILKRA